MGEQNRKRGEWGSFISIVLVAGFFIGWALVPAPLLEHAWKAEQAQMAACAGEKANHWILLQAAGTVSEAAKDAQRSVAELGDSLLEHWLRGRVYVSLLWIALVTYRAFALLMWGLIGIPLLMATSVDSFYVREIRKTAFVSQSPIRHKLGVHFFSLVSVALVLWLCLPMAMPIIAAPAVIVFMAISLWLWVSNLQKRL